MKPEDIMEYCPECDATVIIYPFNESGGVFLKCSNCKKIVDIEQDFDDSYTY